MVKPINLRDDEVPNTADPTEVEAAEFADEQRHAQALNDVRAVLATREGRRAVRRWLGLHGLYESITRIESTSLTYALSGRRDAGLEMLRDLIEADGTSFLAMEEEHRQDEELRAKIAAARRAAAREDEDDLDARAA
jgi:hypothetical protein